MQTPFTFEPPASEKATAFLKARAEHLRTLNPSGQRVFIKTELAFARKLPLSVEENALVKLGVIITLQRWLDEVCEVAA